MLNWISKNRIATIALFAFLMMALLSVEQGRIIANQQVLIRQLYSDSLQLTMLRLHNIQVEHAHQH